jgi:putative hemolysin
VTIIIFPAGGVATAPKGFGKAQDLPWKMFPAKKSSPAFVVIQKPLGKPAFFRQ